MNQKLNERLEMMSEAKIMEKDNKGRTSKEEDNALCPGVRSACRAAQCMNYW